MKYIESYQAGSYRNQGEFKSFIPSPICDDWKWEDSRLNQLLAKANRELGALNSFSELVPDIDTYIRMHIQVEANKSSKIEGTKTSIEDDMMAPEDVNPERRDDALEVNNYIRAMNHGIQRIEKDDFPFTSRLLREMHEILLQGARGEHKTPGEFRRSQNWLGGTKPSDAVYVPPSVPDMADLMSDLDKFMNREDAIPALVRIAILHYQFETIHPFLDGNGRIGRLMIPLYLLSQKELSKPCFYISNFFEQHRTEYYDALQSVRLKNDLLGWVCFFLEAAIHTAEDAKQKFRNVILFVQENGNYAATKRKNQESILKVMRALYQKPVANINEVADLAGLSAPTVRSMMAILMQDGRVKEITGNRRNRVYLYSQYLDIFR